MEPVGLNVPVDGSYSAAAVLQPAVTSTRPSASRVAVSPRGVPSAAVAVPVQLNPGARSGVGVGDGVGAGGPTVVAVAGGPRRGHDGRSTDRLHGADR